MDSTWTEEVWQSRKREWGDKRAWHASPRQIGILAKRCQIKRLILSHISGVTLKGAPIDIEVQRTRIDRIKESYDGEVILAEDLLHIDIE